MRNDIRAQLVYSMFETDEILASLVHDHRLKIIESMNFRQFSQGEPVLFKYKEKDLKLVFCLKGRLVYQSNNSLLFLKEGQIFGSSEMYQAQEKNGYTT